MVQYIGISEARTHFYQILEKVKNGMEFVITIRGKPVARLIPFEEKPEMTRKEVSKKRGVTVLK